MLFSKKLVLILALTFCVFASDKQDATQSNNPIQSHEDQQAAQQFIQMLELIQQQMANQQPSLDQLKTEVDQFIERERDRGLNGDAIAQELMGVFFMHPQLIPHLQEKMQQLTQ